MMLKLEFSPRVLSMILWGFFWGGGGRGCHHGNYCTLNLAVHADALTPPVSQFELTPQNHAEVS